MTLGARGPRARLLYIYSSGHLLFEHEIKDSTGDHTHTGRLTASVGVYIRIVPGHFRDEITTSEDFVDGRLESHHSEVILGPNAR